MIYIWITYWLFVITPGLKNQTLCNNIRFNTSYITSIRGTISARDPAHFLASQTGDSNLYWLFNLEWLVFHNNINFSISTNSNTWILKKVYSEQRWQLHKTRQYGTTRRAIHLLGVTHPCRIIDNCSSISVRVAEGLVNRHRNGPKFEATFHKNAPIGEIVPIIVLTIVGGTHRWKPSLLKMSSSQIIII